MTRIASFLAAATLAPLLAWAGATGAQAQASFTPTQRNDIEVVIHDYLLAHPEVLTEVMAELDKRQTAAEQAKHSVAVKQNAATIFDSKRGVSFGNAQGDVTLVEFFDYNCTFCKRAMADMFELVKSDSKLRFVLREFPVLSEGSVEAAKVAVAVRMQDPGGKKYLEFHTKLLGGRGEANGARALEAAKEAGLDMGQLNKDMASDEIKKTLDESATLADALGLNGTPTYVVGTDVVVGAVGLDTLREKVNVARCGQAAC